MKYKSYLVGLNAFCLCFVFAVFSSAFGQKPENESTLTSSGSLTNNQPASGLLSAFFGLDNALPFRANLLCLGASGLDGMPVVLSRTIEPDSLQPEDFQIVTKFGVIHSPRCVTLRPAQDQGELRTVLLIGEFGNADDDPPALGRVVGDQFTDENVSDKRSKVNFRGTQVEVTPLQDGPSLVFAEIVPLNNVAQDTRGSACPDDVNQIIRVIWNGGVRLLNREELGDFERELYKVTVVSEDSSKRRIVPAALGDLGDGDNNHWLSLDSEGIAISVSIPAGYLAAPNLDLNPDTVVRVEGSEE
ncbi:MAG: hypothetical protein MK324_18725 [Pirellulales bacterium]|nr:hypothetical protein [Pirellulales bacterium]